MLQFVEGDFGFIANPDDDTGLLLVSKWDDGEAADINRRDAFTEKIERFGQWQV